jgi:hypothetical protein
MANHPDALVVDQLNREYLIRTRTVVDDYYLEILPRLSQNAPHSPQC